MYIRNLRLRACRAKRIHGGVDSDVVNEIGSISLGTWRTVLKGKQIGNIKKSEAVEDWILKQEAKA